MKTADTNGTPLAPLGVAPRKPPFKETTTMKTAWLDVSGMEATPLITETPSEHYCLPRESRYPIDTLAQIKVAGEYFEEHYKAFEPPVRREYALNLVKRAAALYETHLPETVRHYGAEGHGSDTHAKVAWELRRSWVDDEAQLAVLDKLASENHQRELPVDDLACLLYAFDKKANLTRLYDKHLADPWASLLSTKVAYFSEQVGTDWVTGMDLELLGENASSLRKQFTDEFVDKFREDPVGTYKGLSGNKRKLVATMARSIRSARGA